MECSGARPPRPGEMSPGEQLGSMQHGHLLCDSTASQRARSKHAFHLLVLLNVYLLHCFCKSGVGSDGSRLPANRV